jgi:hypothetical protein
VYSAESLRACSESDGKKAAVRLPTLAISGVFGLPTNPSPLETSFQELKAESYYFYGIVWINIHRYKGIVKTMVKNSSKNRRTMSFGQCMIIRVIRSFGTPTQANLHVPIGESLVLVLSPIIADRFLIQ